MSACRYLVFGLVPPHVEGGDVFVDGRVLNNLPVDVMRSRGLSKVIGVDVSQPEDLSRPAGYVGTPSAFEVMSSRLADLRDNGSDSESRSFPTLPAILARAVVLKQLTERDLPARTPDGRIEVATSHVKLLEWKALDELVELGYQAGMEVLKNWNPEEDV